MDGTDRDQFDVRVNELNTIIANPAQLKVHFASWVEQKKDEFLQILQPEIGKNIKRLERWHLLSNGKRENWFPLYMTKERQKLLKSLFQCESHQDVMNEILKLQ